MSSETSNQAMATSRTPTAEEVNRAVAKYGRLTLIKIVGRAGTRNAPVWLCKCDCGAVKEIRWADLRSGHTRSCGCFRREATAASKTKHGHARRENNSRVYRTWRGMVERCTNPSCKEYPLYGGRGIKVCDRWRQSFANFLADMGPAPHGLTIDRIENNDGYYKDNCRWATDKEQSANRRTTHLIEVGGVKKPLLVWADEFGLNRGTVFTRFQNGWPVERLFEQPRRAQ